MTLGPTVDNKKDDNQKIMLWVNILQKWSSCPPAHKNVHRKVALQFGNDIISNWPEALGPSELELCQFPLHSPISCWLYHSPEAYGCFIFKLKQLSAAAATAAKSLQSCPTLCDPIDDSPPGSPVPEILQARTLERVAISFSNAWKWKVKSLSRVRLLATPGLQPTRLLCPWDFPGKNTGVGCHCFLRSYQLVQANPCGALQSMKRKRLAIPEVSNEKAVCVEEEKPLSFPFVRLEWKSLGHVWLCVTPWTV